MADVVAEKKIELRVIAPTSATDKSPYKFRKGVDMVIMRCSTGDMGILPGRMPVSAVLGTGMLRIFDEDVVRHMALVGGIAHAGDDVLTILSDEALKPEEINVEKVSAEMKELQRKLEAAEEMVERDLFKKEIHRCQVLLDVAEFKS